MILSFIKKENMPASGNVKMPTSWPHHSAPMMVGPTAQEVASAEDP